MSRRKIKIPSPLNPAEQIEIELPDGYGTREDFEPAIRAAVQTAVDADFARRAAGITATARTALLTDETFKTEALQSWNIDPEKIGKPSADAQQQIAEALQRQEKELVRTRVEPLNKQLGEITKSLQATRGKVLERDILVAAKDANVQDYLLKRVGSGEPAIVGMVRDQFGYDDDTSSWYVKAGDSFAVSTKATQGRLYQDVSEFFTQIAADKEYAGIFKDMRQIGANVGDTTAQRDRAGVVTNDPLSIGRNADKIATGELVVGS